MQGRAGLTTSRNGYLHGRLGSIGIEATGITAVALVSNVGAATAALR
jgi:hypothetical protein